MTALHAEEVVPIAITAIVLEGLAFSEIEAAIFYRNDFHEGEAPRSPGSGIEIESLNSNRSPEARSSC